ncbi:MAG: SDR family oxidoreductase [Treponema sp.]|nr:SDR family oxidoreductase [Treponema sp.]
MIRVIYRHFRKSIIKILRKCKKLLPVKVPVLYSELLKGRCALITGATSGIGLSIANAFLQSGANVILTGRNSQKLSDAKKSLLKALGEAFDTRIETFLIDISDVKEIKNQFDVILSETKFKSIDIFVNNAGVNFGGTFGSTEIDDFESVIETNLEGTYFASQVFARYMKDNKIEGNILHIASSSSNRPAVSAYTCSKWALKGLTQGMAKSLIPYGIIVNALAPGPTATPMLIKDGYDGIEREESPIGRYAAAEEIANMAVVLTSSLGRMIVGETVMMTGGAGVITFDDIPYTF